MYDHKSFLMFLILLIKPAFRIGTYLKLLYFSVPKLSGTILYYQKTKTEPEQLFYY